MKSVIGNIGATLIPLVIVLSVIEYVAPLDSLIEIISATLLTLVFVFVFVFGGIASAWYLLWTMV